MRQSFSIDAASRWANVPPLDPETEEGAARTTIAFLEDVRSRISRHMDAMASGAEPADGSALHEVWDFSSFNPNHIDFLLATLGEGEVRIKLYGGEAKIADTGVPGLWRMQTGKDGSANSFVLCRIPLAVLNVADRGADKIPALVNPGADVFAAPAILQELQKKLEGADLTTVSDRPAPMVELTRQPLSPGDVTAVYSTLGRGDVEIDLLGFAQSTLSSTAVRGIWHTQILNNAGKSLLNAYVVARIPPEAPFAAEEFADGAAKCGELIDWVKGDLERGSLGLGRMKKDA